MTQADTSLLDLLDPSEHASPFWQELESGRLTFARCANCSHAWLPPRAECPQCLGADWEWEVASGRGHLISWVVYHVAYNDAFVDRLPYNVAIVELVEGPRMITNLIDIETRSPHADDEVRLVIVRDGGLALPRFELT